MTEHLISPKETRETLGNSFQGSFHSISDLESDIEDFEDESVVVVESDEEEEDSSDDADSAEAESPDKEDQTSLKTPETPKSDSLKGSATQSPKDTSRRSLLRIPPGRNTSFSDESFPKPRPEHNAPPRRGVTRNISFDGHEGRVIISTLDKTTKPKSYKSSSSLEVMRSATRNPRESMVRKLSVEDLFGPQSRCTPKTKK